MLLIAKTSFKKEIFYIIKITTSLINQNYKKKWKYGDIYKKTYLTKSY